MILFDHFMLFSVLFLISTPDSVFFLKIHSEKIIICIDVRVLKFFFQSKFISIGGIWSVQTRYFIEQLELSENKQPISRKKLKYQY